jgi:hypothetical protein
MMYISRYFKVALVTIVSLDFEIDPSSEKDEDGHD